MPKRLSKHTDATTHTGERQQARTLFWSLLIYALGVLLYLPIVFALLRHPLTPERAASFAPALLIPLLAGWLASRGRRRAANVIFAFGMWIYTTALLLLTPGSFLDAPGAALLIAAALAAASLPPGLGLLTTFLYAISIAGTGAVQFYGWLPVFSAPRELVLTQGSLLLLAELVAGLALNIAARQAARATRQATARTQELETLLSIGRQATASLELDRMLDDVAGALCTAFDMKQVEVLLVERGGTFAELRAAAGQDAPQARTGGHRLRLSQDTTAGQVVATKAPVLNGTNGLTGSVRLPAAYAELGLPLMHNDAVIGVLILRAAEARVFTERTIGLFESFAAQLGPAIHNAQTVATEAALLEAKSPILHAACLIAAADAPHQIVLAIQQTVAPWADTIALLAAGPDGLAAAAVWNRSGTPPEVSYPASLLDALQAAGGLISGEVQQIDADLRDAVAEPLGAAEIVMLSLRRDERSVGALVLAGARSAAYTDADLQALSLLARPAAVMLSNFQHITRLEETTSRATHLYDAVQAMSTATSPEAVYEITLREVVRIMGADRALFFLAGEDDQTGEGVVRRMAVWQEGQALADEAGPHYPDTPTPAIWQIPLTRENRLFNDVQNDSRLVRPLRAEYSRRGVNALAALPLHTGGKWLGSVIVEAQRGQIFDEGQMSQAHRIAGSAARLIDATRMLNQLERAAERDLVVSHITERLESAPNLPLLLKSAVDQLAEVLGTSGVYAELTVGEAEPTAQEPGTADEEVRTQA